MFSKIPIKARISKMLFYKKNTRNRSSPDIQTLAFDSTLYIR